MRSRAEPAPRLIMVPFDARESISIAVAMRLSGKAGNSDRNACRVFRQLTHYIAAPPHRLDIVLAARCAGEFLPQLANKYVDDLHLWLVHPAVEWAQKHFLGERRSLAQRQEFQHLVLRAGHMHARTVDLDRLAIEIDT